METRVLAEVVMALHLAYVGFVVAGYLAVLAGGPLGWGWVRNRMFRLAHLAAIGFVAVEALVGMICPLTVLENALRGGDGKLSFMGWLVYSLLYHNLPPWIFTVSYVVLTALALGLWFWVPPRPRRDAAAGREPVGPARSREEGQRDS